MEVGEAIKTIRKERHMTQKELAHACGLSNNSMCSIEQGLTFPSQKTLDKICYALHIPKAYLLVSCITEEELPDDKKILYRMLLKPFKDELLR